MTHRALSLSTAALLTALSAAPQASAEPHAGRAAVDSQASRQVFDILREGKTVGSHELERRMDGELIRVAVTSQIEVRFLALTLYRLAYRAQETWDRQGLRSLRVSLDDDGERRDLHGQRQGDVFEWVSGEQRYQHPMPVFPTNHWNPAVLQQDQVLNTLTGEINRVEIAEVSREPFALPSTATPATRYRYSGDLQLESWYDDHGRWLGMRFRSDDGSLIEYRCRDCAHGLEM